MLATKGARHLGLDFEDVGQPAKGRVTDQNKAEYVALKVRHLLIKPR
jgi:hypothetical protein